jgi:hypothetical protein
VPLPAHAPRQIAGLLTIVMPPTVKTGEKYRVLVRQYSKRRGRIIGTFEVLIAVRDAVDILAGEARLLAVLKSIALGIKPASAWFLVFQRYVATVANRVRGLGGDPNQIGPSPGGVVPEGALPKPPDNAFARCCSEVQRRLHTLTLTLGVGVVVLLLILFLLLLKKF